MGKLMKTTPLRSSHDDSGFDGLNSTEKVHDEKFDDNFIMKHRQTQTESETQTSTLPQTKDLASSYNPDPPSKSDQFWSTAVNYLMLVVVGASVCYIVLMGVGEDQVKLGGRRAA